MRWTVHGEKPVYESPWVSVLLADIEVPGGERHDHHVVRMPTPAAAVIVHDPSRGVLMLWRHRFITDTWGWEIPAGRCEPGEDEKVAAAREALEETGWRPGPLTELFSYHPSIGLIDQLFYVFEADGAKHTGPPDAPEESEKVEWIPLDELDGLIRRSEIRDGYTLTALLWWLHVRRRKT